MGRRQFMTLLGGRGGDVGHRARGISHEQDTARTAARGGVRFSYASAADC